MTILIPCLVRLRDEVNTIAPTRDKASDGWIGDTAHQDETSDHNDDETGAVPIHDADKIHEVHAIDIDVDLRESDLTAEKIVQHLVARCRSGAEQRLRYVIYNRRIWSASNGWRQATYTGSDPHTGHIHISGSYVTALEASTASWHLEDIPVALTTADKAWVVQAIREAVAALPTDTAKQVLLDYRLPGTETAGSDYRRNLMDLVADPWAMAMLGATRAGDPIPPTSIYAALMQQLAAVNARLDQLTKAAA